MIYENSSSAKFRSRAHQLGVVCSLHAILILPRSWTCGFRHFRPIYFLCQKALAFSNFARGRTQIPCWALPRSDRILSERYPRSSDGSNIARSKTGRNAKMTMLMVKMMVNRFGGTRFQQTQNTVVSFIHTLLLCSLGRHSKLPHILSPQGGSPPFRS